MQHSALALGLIERFDLQIHSSEQPNFYEVDNEHLEELIAILKIRFPELHTNEDSDCYYIGAETHDRFDWIVNTRDSDGDIQNWIALDVKVINDSEVHVE